MRPFNNNFFFWDTGEVNNASIVENPCTNLPFKKFVLMFALRMMYGNYNIGAHVYRHKNLLQTTSVKLILHLASALFWVYVLLGG